MTMAWFAVSKRNPRLACSSASGAPTSVHHNELFAPACSGTDPRHGALRAGGGEVLVDANLLNVDTAQVGDCGTGCVAPALCAGIQTAGGTLTITNNIAFGGRGPAAAALALNDEPLGYGAYVINGDTVRWEPAIDINRLAGTFATVVIVWLLTRGRRTRRRRPRAYRACPARNMGAPARRRGS